MKVIEYIFLSFSLIDEKFLSEDENLSHIIYKIIFEKTKYPLNSSWTQLY